jgi:hypothetical protein
LSKEEEIVATSKKKKKKKKKPESGYQSVVNVYRVGDRDDFIFVAVND